jgi:shikimate 5-dehydrogenase
MDEIKRIMIKETTKITGIFGNPIEHYLSSIFTNAVFQALGFDLGYVLRSPTLSQKFSYVCSS